MGCYNRSTHGIIIGSICILFYLICTVISIRGLIQINDSLNMYELRSQKLNDLKESRTILIIVLVFALAMILISSLLITGIVKRRHKLMMPWLLLTGIGYIYNCGHFVFTIFSVAFFGTPWTQVLLIVIVGVVVLSLGALLIWPIFVLFGDIRKENIQKAGRVIGSTEVGYKNQQNI